LSKPLTEEEYVSLDDVINEYITLEARMINTIRRLLVEIKDKRITYILKYIHDDEIRHHALLKGIHRVIANREVVTEFDWMDIAWKDVPFFY